MKRIALSLAALGVLAVVNTPATASDLSVLLRGMFYDGHNVVRENHVRHHDDLEHRGYHQELDHRTAHRYPMTYRQHDNLHDNLDHDAFHDDLEHRSAHRSRAYSPYRGNGLNFRFQSYGSYSPISFGSRYPRH